MNEIGIILVAAGSSSRMGQPKQLLAWDQSTLLHSMASIACNAGIGPVIVVLGCEEDRCRASLKGLPVKISVNDYWQKGMGSSIACGIRMMATLYPAISAAIIMQCDQVAVDEHLLKQLAHLYEKARPSAILCQYDQALGPPALFDHSMFNKLSRLCGSQGAKIVWEQASSKATLDFPGGHQDLDTWEQYQAHLSNRTQPSLSLRTTATAK